ncbi:ROK family protein [Phaeacidiphilus oryzae]|uniref:ROK family protein n=1 Tax=Phaeacidiphilus oryzae TaxID=348818 RepID=UPI00068DFB0F|nr:ROK family protein [Phaeacidiphilus oryzae]
MTPTSPRTTLRQDAPAGRSVLALDIGGTKLAAGVVRDDGAVLSFRTVPTRVQEGPEAALARLFTLGREALRAAGADAADPADTAGPYGSLLGCGIGCGGPLDSATGTLIAPPHLPGWLDIPIAGLARREYGLPAVLDNDGTAGAAGEWRFGAGRGTRHLVYLTVSTGIGGGVVIDGRTYRGAAGNGGEPGHITVRTGGRPCRSCGRRGCLEAYASGTSIAERAREAVREETAAGHWTALAEHPAEELGAADVARAALDGDALAVRLWRETTELLGDGLTSIVNLYEPEVLVLGGGVTRSGDQLLLPVRESVARQAMAPAAAACRVVLATGGDRAGVLGAAAIAFERLTAGRDSAEAAVPAPL